MTNRLSLPKIELSLVVVSVMEETKMHVRHILLFLFRKGESAAKARRQICDVYGAKAITRRITEYWFHRFRSGSLNIKGSFIPGRPLAVKDEQILELVTNDCHVKTREIAQRLGISHSTAASRLKKLGMVNKADIWVSHELTDRK